MIELSLDDQSTIMICDIPRTAIQVEKAASSDSLRSLMAVINDTRSGREANRARNALKLNLTDSRARTVIFILSSEETNAGILLVSPVSWASGATLKRKFFQPIGYIFGELAT